MIIKRAEIVAVTGRKDQYPEDDRTEVAFAGRSNVGKSSLLNYLTNRKKLAKVSGAPGKTRTINFYDINGEFRIVDLPGYGYARVSKGISATWGKMIEDYLESRNGLVRVVQLVDIRHDPTKQDIQMYEYLRHFNLHGTVVATKSDKISRNHLDKHLANVRKHLNMGNDEVIIPASALRKQGKEEILNHLEGLIGE